VTFATMSIPTDIQLQRNVHDELHWEPTVDATKIGVAVTDGVVTLTGAVSNFFEKWEAEAAAKRVYGVKALANDIEIRLLGDGRRDDTDIARAAAEALAWNASVPRDRVKVVVSDGWLTLDGEVDLRYQKEAAENAVRCLYGVKGVSNQISVRRKITATDIKTRIEEAFLRSAILDAGRIRVETDGSRVTLRGEVRSWAERREAERTAWAAPGVSHVEAHISVTLPFG